MASNNSGEYQNQSWGPLVSQTPLCRIRTTAINQLANLLNTKRILMSDPNDRSQKCRDYKGLAEHAKLSISENSRVEISSPNDRVNVIINIWSRKPGIMVKHLLEALDIIERFDAVEDMAENVKADCLHASTSNIPDPLTTIRQNPDAVTRQVILDN